MTNQVIGVGTTANDGTGDALRAGMIKVNANFAELYGLAPSPLLLTNGAKMDGTTDDYAALSAFLTAVGNTNQVSVVINGPMLIGTSVTIPYNVQLVFFGQGKLKPAANKTITLNCPIVAGAWQIFDISASGSAVVGNIKNDVAYPYWYGAKNDGTTDCTVGITAALALAHGSGDIPVHLLSGVHITSATIPLNGTSGSGTFTHPDLVGCSKKQTFITYTSITSNSTAIQAKGGSGQISGGSIRNIYFTGNSTSTAIEFAGQCGSWVENCYFDANAIGVRFHNDVSGAFTEFCTVRNCEFRAACTTTLEYKRTSGNNSFHGSGFDVGKNTINASSTGPVVSIDGTSCYVYNAPCYAQIFSTTNSITVFQNGNSVAPIPVSFAGQLSIETNTGVTTTLGGGASVLFAGPVRVAGATTASGDNVVAGTFLRVDTVNVHADSSVSYTGAKAARKYTLTIPSASTAAINISGPMNSVYRMVDFNLFASNFLKRMTLLVDFFGDGSTSITPNTVATRASFDNPGGTLGYQPPTFTGSSNGSFNIVVPTVAKTAGGAFTGGETSTSFSTSWQSPTGTYNWTFSNGDIRAVSCTQGATTATWTGGLSGAATTAITAQTWPVGSSTFTVYVNEVQMSNGIQASGHTQY
jgi:hypothetical protein